MIKNYRVLRDITTSIKDTLNPFDINIKKDCLFNLSTGKAATCETKEFLLNINKLGLEARDNFIKECRENPLRFEQPIKKYKISAFVNKGKKVNSNNCGKVEVTKFERDLLGRMLMLVIQNRLNLENVLSFLLTQKTNKQTKSFRCGSKLGFRQKKITSS